MNRSFVYLFAVLFVVGVMAACGTKISIQELHPGVSFMDKTEVTAFMTGAMWENENEIVSYKQNGTASVYVKKNKKEVPGAWMVEDDGMITLMTRGNVEKWYTSSDGTTAYNIDGTMVKINKK